MNSRSRHLGGTTAVGGRARRSRADAAAATPTYAPPAPATSGFRRPRCWATTSTCKRRSTGLASRSAARDPTCRRRSSRSLRLAAGAPARRCTRRRAARPHPDATRRRITPGRGAPTELLLRPGRFSALRNDCATAHPDATPAPTPAALCEIFEATLISHFKPIVVALNGRCGRSTRALWRTIGDRTATALLHAALACKERHAGEQHAHQILRGAPPLEVTPAYASILIDDRFVPVHLRLGCCLWWRTAAATYCATCPLRHPVDRARS